VLISQLQKYRQNSQRLMVHHAKIQRQQEEAAKAKAERDAAAQGSN
jgi:chaperonin cofactor prefoldin